MENVGNAPSFVYFGNPADFDYENDYDFIIGFLEGGDHYMYKPDSLPADQKIYLLAHETETINGATGYCFPRDFLKS